MARKHSDKENVLLERAVKRHRENGSISWDGVAKEISEALDGAMTPGAVQTWYYRLTRFNGVKRSPRAGDKTLERVVKWLRNTLESNHRMRAELSSKKGRRHTSAQTELLKKKVKELREETASLKTELKSHRPILRWWIRTQRALKSADKAIIE